MKLQLKTQNSKPNTKYQKRRKFCNAIKNFNLKFLKNELNKEFSLILDRLKKVQKLKQNPYSIRKFISGRNEESPIDWIDFTPESMYQDRLYGAEYYEVIFDDVTLLSLRKHYHEFEGNTLTFYEIYIKETDSDQRNIEPVSHISNSIKKKFWVILADIFDKQKQYKQSDRLGSMINPAADLL